MKQNNSLGFGPPSAMSTLHRRHKNNSPKPKKDLTTGAILPQLIAFCLPLVLSGTLQLLFNASDMAVLRMYATDTAVGAVGSCGSLINLIINLFIGLATGVSVIVAQYVGAKRENDVSEIVHTAFSLALIMGVVVGVIGYILAEPALRLMGTLDDTLAEAAPYMRAYMLGVPGVMVYNYCAAALRAKGDTVRPLIFLFVSGLANVVLNLWMVIGFGMGAVGVGIATAISQYIAAGLTVIYMSCILKDSCHLSLRRMVIKQDKVWLMLKIGLPAGVQGVLFSFSNVMIQSSVNSFGIEALVNGNTAASSVEGFVYTAQNSTYQGAITFVGQHVGARKYGRINRVIFSCAGLAIAAWAVFGSVALIFGEQLLGFFVNDSQAIAYGMRRMSIVVSTYFLCGLMEVGCGAMRGMGKVVLPMIVSLAGACGLRIVWIMTVFQWFNTPACLYLSYPVSWTITMIAHFIFAFYTKHKLEQTERERSRQILSCSQ